MIYYFHLMPLTYIAFIECVLRPNGHWIRKMGRPDFSRAMGEQWTPKGISAEMDLVDIKRDMRYFKFHNHDAVVRIENNVVVFDGDDAEEVIFKDSIMAPKKKRIDE